MDPLTLGLAVGPSLLRLGEGLFGPSAEEQYRKAQQENIRRAVAAINAESAIQRNRESRRASDARRLARQGGARRAAAAGFAGDTDVFTSGEVSGIDQNLNEAISRINENQQLNTLRAEASYPTLPSYEFPNAVDYVASGAESAADYLALDRAMGLQEQQVAGMDGIAEAIAQMNAGAYSPGLNVRLPRRQYRGMGYPGALDEQDLRLGGG